MANSPTPEAFFPNKSYAIGIIAAGETVVYPFEALRAQVGEVGIVQDTVGDQPIVVAFDLRDQTAVILNREVDGEVLEFAVE